MSVIGGFGYTINYREEKLWQGGRQKIKDMWEVEQWRNGTLKT